MVLQSLIRENNRLVPAEVEVLLLPGLPQIQVLGLPDQVIKESLHRVRSALRTQGFDWPRARQVLVNIRPVDQRKSSRGLELAIAAGLIWEMGQKKAPLQQKGMYVYGELSLSGEVSEPDDLATDFLPQENDLVLTGVGDSARGFTRQRISCLQDLDKPLRVEACGPLHEIFRPQEGLQRFFSAAEARALMIAALGEHHWLLAGASGAGKTTLARSLKSFLAPPSDVDLREGRAIDGWRPWIAPHHSASALSLIGGGVPPKPGEISRADTGILFLDELLEFDPSAQEALREPVETGEIRLSRGQSSRTFPARLQLIATTNLCPCGRWVPGEKITCGRSWRRCRSALEKISGPFFDRFDLLTFAGGSVVDRKMSGEKILERLLGACEFRRSEKRPLTRDLSRLQIETLWEELDEPWRSELRESSAFQSERRRLSTLRVARTIADLEGSLRIRGFHLQEAMDLGFKNFDQLHSGDMGV